MIVNKTIPVIIKLPPIGPSYNPDVFAEHSLFNYTIGNTQQNISSPLKDDLHLNSWKGEQNSREMNNISYNISIKETIEREAVSNSGNCKTERGGKKKTVTCIFFERGYRSNGKKCRYLHNTDHYNKEENYSNSGRSSRRT